MSDSLPTTANVHLVTAHEGRVLVMMVPPPILSVQQAIELAAWLVAMADCADAQGAGLLFGRASDEPAAVSVEDRFRAALAAVRNT